MARRGLRQFTNKAVPNIKTAKEKHRENTLDILFELKFVKNVEDMKIFDNRNDYKEFWLAWESYNSMGYKFQDLNRDEVREFALRSLKTMVKKFYQNKKYRKRIDDIKRIRDVGCQPIDAINQIVYSEITEEVIKDEENNEISRNVKTEITAKKIERIEFVSEVTIKAIENITESQKMAEEWIIDYKAAIDSIRNGGQYHGRHKFYHLELDAKYKRVALELAEKYEETIVTGSPEEIKEANMRFTAASKLHQMMKNVMESELSILNTITRFHEGGEARQRELMGAINTDRQLIEMGNAIVKEEKEVIDRSKLRMKLKEQGYSKIQDILAAELKNVGAIQDELDIPDETIIDVEVTEEADDRL